MKVSTFSRIAILFRLVVEALKGEHKEFTSGSINKALFMLSVPMIMEMVMESVFAVVDVFFVGKISINAVATVGLTESILMLIYSISIGLSIAATALVSRRIGEKNNEEAVNSATQAVFITAALSVLLAVPGIVYAKDILRIMGGSEELVASGYMYARIMIGGNATIMFLFLFNGIFRGAGDASISMKALWIANIINIILDPVFIFGFSFIPAFGLEGAAIATTIGRGIAVLYQIFMLTKGDAIIRIKVRNFRLNPAIMFNMIKISIGGTSQFLIESASWIFLVRILSTFGSDVLAGYTIALRIVVFTILPSMGLSNAAATLVGQNLGAREYDRAEQSVWKAAFFNMLFLGGVSVVFIFFADELIGLFSNEPIVIRYGKMCLQILCIGYVFFAYGMVLTQSFNGAGDTRTPTYINLFCHWVFQIPFAYFLSIFLEMGPKGTFIAVATSFSLQAFISMYLFKKGKWKATKV